MFNQGNWVKNGVVFVTINPNKPNGTGAKYSYSKVTETVTPSQLRFFAQAIKRLTGDTVVSVIKTSRVDYDVVSNNA